MLRVRCLRFQLLLQRFYMFLRPPQLLFVVVQQILLCDSALHVLAQLLAQLREFQLTSDVKLAVFSVDLRCVDVVQLFLHPV